MTLQKRIKVLNITGYVLIAIQILSFIGGLGLQQEPITDTAELVGYYLGSNLFLMIAIVLFFRARMLRKRLKKQAQIDIIDSIGKAE